MAKRTRRASGVGGSQEGKGSAGEAVTGRRSTRRGTTADYRHAHEKRANIPPAKIAAEGQVPAIPKARYSYSPHRPPVLRFNPAGEAERLAELAAKVEAGQELSEHERQELAAALRQRPAHEPWLEWAGNREEHQRGHFDVDPVALHTHERVSAQAILKVAARQDVDRGLFGDPEQEYHEAKEAPRWKVGCEGQE